MQGCEEKERMPKERGLSAAEVERLTSEGKVNTPPVPLYKTNAQIIAKNTLTFFNLIFAVLTVLLILVEDFRSLTFLPIIILNTVVGIVQEIRSKHELQKLSMLNAPRTRVLREGAEALLPSEQLVLGDVVIFAAGSQIPADATVLSGEAQVNEALLTGEADEIPKRPGDALCSGSFIVSGECVARLTQVGAESSISKLTLEAKNMKGVGKSKMLLELDKLLKWIGIIIVPIGAALFASGFFRLDITIGESVTSMVAALIGMIPEGLYLLTTAALVLGMLRLAKNKVLVHEMNCIEMLARVDVLCVDKTGTITEPDMKVIDYIPIVEMEEARKVLGDFALAMPKDNATMAALKAYFTESAGQPPLKVCGFSSEFKYSAAAFDWGCIVVGAPEFVLREKYQAYHEKIEKYAGQGYRVLAAARYAGCAEGKALTEDAELIGLILLENPIRESAPATFRYFDEQGVNIKVISGDNPLTVSRVAARAGVKDAESYVDASSLKDDAMLEEAVQKYTVFGRVTPAQKRSFVRILKKLGHTVAMTGDGVNDVLALKDADCSVAMASGSEAAAQCAQMVLMDSDFSRMPDVVGEGRRVVNNIERSASLFLVKNIFSIIMALLSLVFAFQYPILPAQMSLISGFTIGVPAFLLALESNKQRISGNFLRGVAMKALPAGMTDVILISAIVTIDQWLGLTFEQSTTACFILMAVVGMLILYQISRPLNAFRTGVLISMIAATVMCAIFMPKLFSMVELTLPAVLCLIALSFCAIPLMMILTKLMQRIEKQIA